MIIYKKFLLVFILILLGSKALANDIFVDNFDELINSQPINGDVIEFTNNLDSDASIGNHFLNLSLTFEGHNHYLNGNNTFSGFILNQDSIFNEVDIRNCKGQEYQGSDFAGAAFNFNGNMSIDNSHFSDNFVDAGDTNYGIGGAVYNLNSGVISIDSTNFTGNYAHGALAAGGAVANGFSNTDNPEMIINNSIFENNHSLGELTSEGGALHNKGNITISNTIFRNNYSESGDEYIDFSYGVAIISLISINLASGIISFVSFDTKYKVTIVCLNCSSDISSSGVISSTSLFSLFLTNQIAKIPPIKTKISKIVKIKIIFLFFIFFLLKTNYLLSFLFLVCPF